ncbi:unnamed protein product [Malus baccata var. baccata]
MPRWLILKLKNLPEPALKAHLLGFNLIRYLFRMVKVSDRWFMTRSSQPIHKHIRDFDDDFERTLRRARNQQEPQPSQPTPDLGEDKVEEQEEPTAQVIEEDPNMAADNRTIKELSTSGLDNPTPLCIQYPMAALGKTDEFELKSSLLYHIPKFHGMSMEDPNKHLKEFEVVCSSMTPVNVDGSIMKMKAFPFSLLEKAKDWLYELAPGTVTSWESMKRAFLEKFFPTSRVILLRKRISGIQQNQGESFPTYYERFKTLVALCPQHQMKEDLLLQYFYEGLLPIECQMLDASAGGALVDKTPMAAKILIANRALNAQQYEGVGQRDTLRQQVNEGQESQAKAMQNQDKRVNQMEKQIGQIAEFVGQFREQGKLPSSTVMNPKGRFESVKAIMLRSGKEVGNESDTPKSAQKRMKSYKTRRGALAHLRKGFMQSNKDESEKDILKTFRKVQVNIPLLEAIKQVPKYAKFLKTLCTTKTRMSNKEVVKVRENVSAVLQRKLPTKCKDPGSFTIPCVIGNTLFENAMLDLGASINVMPYSIYASMNLGELKKDGVIIQLADRSNAYPKGVLKDVLMQVNHLIFPTNFYVLDMEDSVHSTSLPILLGRPFMKTAHTKIDVFKGTLTMEFDGEVINFNISETMRYPDDDHSCFSIDVIDSLAQEYLEELNKDALEIAITKGINSKTKNLGQGKPTTRFGIPMPCHLMGKLWRLWLPLSHFHDNMAPTLELKPLPDHLKYVFLGDDETLPVIVSSSLTTHEEEKLIRVLREHKTAIGWTLADIRRGSTPSQPSYDGSYEEGNNQALRLWRDLSYLR